MKPKIQIIVGSTRQGRQGEMVGSWFRNVPEERRDLAFEYLDLRDWPLPFFGTSESPLVAKWQQKIGEADGYVIVTPEYHYSFTAALKNALDYGGKFWRNKPVGFIGYTAGDTGAACAVEQLRLVAIELQLAPIREAVHLSGVLGPLSESIGNEAMQNRLDRFFAQLGRWAAALKAARTECKVPA